MTMETSTISKADNIKTTNGQKKQSILVIDDSPDMLNLNRELLEMNNYEVFTAQSGHEGLEMISKINSIDLVLLDMQMDDLTGTEFLQLLEEQNSDFLKNVPVVFFTGMDSIPESKASGFIQKAGDMNKFLEKIRYFISQGRTCEEKKREKK